MDMLTVSVLKVAPQFTFFYHLKNDSTIMNVLHRRRPHVSGVELQQKIDWTEVSLWFLNLE